MTNTLKIRAVCLRARKPEITVERVCNATGIHKYAVQALMHDMARRGELIRVDVNVYRRNRDFVPNKIQLPNWWRRARPMRPSRAMDLLQAAWR